MLKMFFLEKAKRMEWKKIILNKTKSLNMLYTSSKGYREYVAVHEQKKKILNRNHSVLKGSSSQNFLL